MMVVMRMDGTHGCGAFDLDPGKGFKTYDTGAELAGGMMEGTE